MNKLFALAFLFPFACFGQLIHHRKYKEGETERYRLTVEVYNNNKFSNRTNSVSEHRVVKTASGLSEEINWLHKTLYMIADTIVMDSTARKVSPYNISVMPGGELPLPKFTVTEMVGDITDLHTFFVAISPEFNAHKLSLKNPVFKNMKTVHGDFADSVSILLGKDCMEVSQHLVSTTKKYSVIKTEFLAPSFFCLEPLLDTISKNSFGQPNNFQMLRKGGDGKLILMWGVETFTIDTKIDNKTGKIINAYMINVLNLRMRMNVSQDLKTYAAEIPLTIERELKLEALE